MGIEGRLVQIFQNLIANAETFSLKSDVIRITISSDKQAVIIYVDDDGPGISPGNESKIFSRFYTERAETEKFGTHSGLGLSISLQIATAHRGQISAKNRKDNTGAILGARFTVQLPLA